MTDKNKGKALPTETTIEAREVTTPSVLGGKQIAPLGLLNDPYRYILQGPVANTIARVHTKSAVKKVDPISDMTLFENENITVSFHNYLENPQEWTLSTTKLFHALVLKLTSGINKDQRVFLELSELKSLYGVKDDKTLRQSVNKDLAVMYNASILYTGTCWTPGDTNFKFRLFEGQAIIKNSVIMVMFGRVIHENLIKNKALMPYQVEMLKINNRDFPHAYYLGIKIHEHKFMNREKSNENHIRVESLLKAVPSMPKYEKIAKSGRQLNQRIIEPFIKNMDALDRMFSWEFWRSKNEQMRDEDLTSYKSFANLIVKIHWHNYPLLPPRKKRRKRSNTKKNNRQLKSKKDK